MNETQVRDLVHRAKDGDRAAFDALTTALGARLLGLVRPMLGAEAAGRVEVEDILQEMFLRAYERLDRLEWRGEAAFVAWLQRIAEHVIWNVSQKRGPLELPREDRIEAPDVSPERAIRREERQRALESAIGHLSSAQREAMRLVRIEGLPVRAVAEHMGKSEAAVKMLISRALRTLRDRLAESVSLRLPAGPLVFPEEASDGED